MHQFYTPLKQNNQSAKQQSRPTPKTREGDWVCYNCSNLNFSFRKKCNRCKVQTKEHNDQISNYYTTLYPQDCFYLDEKENFPSLQNTSQHTPLSSHKTLANQPKRSTIMDHCERVERTPQRQAPKSQLPSVSPLVKRYNRNENQSTKESKSKGLFEDDCLWANIDLKYCEDPLKEDKYQLDEQVQEIQKIIQRIIL